ncbi:Beta-glucuronosyltransferase glcat14a [Thalictrum thalictroides]|uniref:Beta-glucuronosyltransferase glcat14a n=1 Tax=Thalictrum thalictroides TaxID=46969 RepID=A0A7J6X7X2_THATH|nr:Beta-glucuronosyltransferase glcat14a [Thalictrum thalictroides]
MAIEKKWVFTLFSVTFISITTLLFSISFFISSFAFISTPTQFPSPIQYGNSYPPSFAYYITGSGGDTDRLLRLLFAVYHPRNSYLLHLDADASDEERIQLALTILKVPVFKSFGNVYVLGKPDRLVYMGSSNIAATLHAAAVLLKINTAWDWFITLSSADYPLLTPDDIAHVFSSVRRDLNFIDHTSDLGWKEYQRVQPIVVDPGIYLARRSQIFYASEKRPTPEAFKFFTGSPWVTLSRSFLEYCISGWDDLPRMLLMYFTNAILPQESYFHSVSCNSPEFNTMSVNSDLRYIVWDNPPTMEPHFLNVTDYDQMIQSGAAFARQFQKNDPVLNIIDKKILMRSRHQVAPGAWCIALKNWWTDPCSKWGDVNVVKPGPQAEKFRVLMSGLLNDSNAELSRCK